MSIEKARSSCGPDCMRDGNETGPSETAGREPSRRSRAGSTPEGRGESRRKGSAKGDSGAMAARGTGGQSGASLRDGPPTRRRYNRAPASVRGGEIDGRKERRTINNALDQCIAEKQTVERNIELLTAQFAEYGTAAGPEAG